MVDYENELYEQYEELFKNLGQGDTSGKIVGLLMVGEQSHYTLDELSEYIGRSKSTIHNAIKRLQQLQIVDYQIADSEPSEGRYPHLYTFSNNFLKSQLTKMDAISSFRQLLGDAIIILRDRNDDDPRISNLEEIYALYAWFEEELPDFLASWHDLYKSGEYRKYLDRLEN